MYKFNITYQVESAPLLKGVVLYHDSEDFEAIVRIFKEKYPEGRIKAVLLNEY